MELLMLNLSVALWRTGDDGGYCENEIVILLFLRRHCVALYPLIHDGYFCYEIDGFERCLLDCYPIETLLLFSLPYSLIPNSVVCEVMWRFHACSLHTTPGGRPT